jgi:phosphatidylinositol-3-phosphatase
MTSSSSKCGVAAAAVVFIILSVSVPFAAVSAAAATARGDGELAQAPSGPGVTSLAVSATRGQKVLVIVDENHTQSQVQAGMPYLVSLQDKYGVTTHHTAVTNPSLPNYLVIAGGGTFGVTDDAPPSSHPVSGSSVFGAALAQGMTARAYNQAMTVNCQQSSSGTYAVKHNPWAYFVDERAACLADDVPLTQLAADIGSGHLPDVGMITPDMCNDGHDCPLGTADAFLQKWVPRIKNGPDYWSGRLTIVITFDEGIGSNQTIETVVINPRVKGIVVTAALTHAGLRYLSSQAGHECSVYLG